MKPQSILKTTCIFLTFLFFQVSYSQQREVLPKGFSEKEKIELSKGIRQKNTIITTAPSGPVRTAAEWEEVEYLVISWDNNFNDILSEIVKAGVEECKVVIAYYGVTETTIKNKLRSSPYSMTNTEINDNVVFLSAPTNSIWIRDFAGNTIYTDDVGELGLADWRYNRNRNYDDTVPTAHGIQLNIPVYVTNMVNTGGNFMSDGMGNGFASELVISENNVTPYFHYGLYPEVTRNEAEIDAIMQDYMGISSYYKMPILPYDGIHHIDMHMKLLDEETILVSKYPDGVADGPQIEANINQLLNDKVSAFGTPYKIEWINCPSDKYGYYPSQYDNSHGRWGSYATYSNSIIINKSILLPNYTVGDNAAAIARYEELMPGYKIVGIDVETTEDLIRLSGAIHCITHTIGVEKPLLIVHQPVEEVGAGSAYNITAMIKHIDNIKEAIVKWRIAGSEGVGSTVFPNEVAMTKEVASDNWTANMPVVASNSDIEYFIEATSNGTVEKTLTRPLTAVKTDPSDAAEPIGFYTVISNSTLSINKWDENIISLPYPNPAHDKVNFNLRLKVNEVNVSVFNNLGQKLFDEIIKRENGDFELKLNNEWSGVLLVVFEGDFGRFSKKIIKKK